ncbi:hypothetical protein G9A89_001627 [Geosiphon pyriformis]|nr:hypothetical protein G9A89_001627 [Geosiphon pyriformis]
MATFEYKPTKTLYRFFVETDEELLITAAEELLELFDSWNRQWRLEDEIINEVENWLTTNKHDATDIFQTIYQQQDVHKFWSLLGFLYRRGIGTKVNEDQAFHFYKLAAQNGDAIAQNEVGVCYHEGIGVNLSREEAFKWYRVSAEAGNAFGLSNMAYCYEKSIGTQKDSSRAFINFEKAACMGYSVAKNDLGHCYFHGIGTKKNQQKGFWWYHDAAESNPNHVAAQENVAYCKELGYGTERDVHEAIKYCLRAKLLLKPRMFTFQMIATIFQPVVQAI